MTEYERLRKEFSSAKFHKQLPEKCGTVCVNCADTENIEYHHIVPLEVGGTNRFTNIAPVCLTCHMKIHMGNFVAADRIARIQKKSGRKRRCPDNYKDILHDYLHCKISKTECIEQMGINCNTKLSDYIWFREYLEECNIFKYRNNTEIIRKKNGGTIPDGRQLGYIVYNDRVKKCFFKNGDSVKEVSEKSKRATRSREYDIKFVS